jgi:LuxR family quorum sensing-dependent transcriptional regulator
LHHSQVYVSDYDQTLLFLPNPAGAIWDNPLFMDGAPAGAYLSEGAVQPRAYRNSLNHTLAFIRDLDRARNLDDVAAQVLRHVAPFGAEHVIATSIPRVGATRRQQLDSVLFHNIPAAWVDRYSSRGYAFKDPTVRRMASGAAPFFWNELDEDVRDNPAARVVLDEAKEFHLGQGFSTSLLTLDGQGVGFSLCGQHCENDPEMRGMLTLIATYAIGRAIALKQEKVPDAPVILSAREREALQWASEGKGDWEIGEVMNISEHGADKHMRSVRTKLGVINRTQAVAEAIRRGLIA